MKVLRININQSAWIDDEDYERCKNFHWRINRQTKRRKGRVVRTAFVYTRVKIGDKFFPLRLARYVMDLGGSARITYINDNHMDCRKANLKVRGVRQDMPRPKFDMTHQEILDAALTLPLEEVLEALHAGI